MPIASVTRARILYIMESFTRDPRRISRLLDYNRVSVHKNECQRRCTASRAYTSLENREQCDCLDRYREMFEWPGVRSSELCEQNSEIGGSLPPTSEIEFTTDCVHSVDGFRDVCSRLLVREFSCPSGKAIPGRGSQDILGLSDGSTIDRAGSSANDCYREGQNRGRTSQVDNTNSCDGSKEE